MKTVIEIFKSTFNNEITDIKGFWIPFLILAIIFNIIIELIDRINR